ncbi:FAD/NAD(P)-binding domain-containing protein [Lizonia empirigonia]|nr:FAD/NAD(P)-binding domain-containing protein [Lizonia empirigonia]
MTAPKIQRVKTIIVGAGFGGLGMAIALKKDGEEDFLVLEKFSDVGGVWRDNRYPGCSCDVPSHLYSFSFAPYKSGRRRYTSQKEILRYLQGVAADYKVKEKIILNTKVSGAYFRQNERRWDIHTSSGHYQAEVVVFATGQLHQPNYPQIPGLREEFTGPVMHSAQWDDDVDLRNKRIAVIGTGSSAAQMLPTLAERASEVTIYQREPHWVLPKPDMYFSRIERLLLKLPGAHEVYRKALSHGADILLSPIPRCRAWRYVVECYAN